MEKGAISRRVRHRPPRNRKEVPNRFRRAIGNLTLSKLAAFLLVLIVIASLYRDLTRDVLIIEPFSVPKQYADIGLTGEVIANHIGDEMSQMEGEALINEKRVGLKSENVTSADYVPSVIDVEVPGTKLGLKTVVEIVRDILGIHQKRVRGDVVIGRAALSLNITVHTSGLRRPDSVRRYSGPVDDPQQIPALAAVAILHNVNPFALGVWEYLHDDMASVAQIGHEMVGDSDRLERARGHNFIGLVYADKERWKHAAEEFKQVTKLAPGLSFGYANWGFALLQDRKPEDAIALYNKAIQIDPRLTSAFNYWGLTLYLDGKPPAEGDRKFEEAIHLDPLDPYIYGFWGDALVSQRNWSEALAKYEKAAELDPKFWHAYLMEGSVLAAENQWDQAGEQYEKAAAVLPRSARPLLAWGIALYQQKRYEDAIAKFRRATEIDPKSAEAHFWWGGALIEQRQPGKAIEQCRMGLETDPTNKLGYQVWADALNQMGNTVDASEKNAKAQALAAQQ